MRIKLHKNFVKRYQKLTSSQKNKFKARRDLFLQDQFNPLLNNHALKGSYQGYRSFNVSGDIRVVFNKTGQTTIFITVDSHSNLYR